MKIDKFKTDFYKELLKIKIKGIISMKIVGSFVDTKKLNKVNDIDIVIIFKKLTPYIFKKLNDDFIKIKRKIENNDLKVIIETRLIPTHPKSIKNKKVIQLHIILSDLFF